jgi:hypothetical protein
MVIMKRCLKILASVARDVALRWYIVPGLQGRNHEANTPT